MDVKPEDFDFMKDLIDVNKKHKELIGFSRMAQLMIYASIKDLELAGYTSKDWRPWIIHIIDSVADIRE